MFSRVLLLSSGHERRLALEGLEDGTEPRQTCSSLRWSTAQMIANPSPFRLESDFAPTPASPDALTLQTAQRDRAAIGRLQACHDRHVSYRARCRADRRHPGVATLLSPCRRPAGGIHPGTRRDLGGHRAADQHGPDHQGAQPLHLWPEIRLSDSRGRHGATCRGFTDDPCGRCRHAGQNTATVSGTPRRRGTHRRHPASPLGARNGRARCRAAFGVDGRARRSRAGLPCRQGSCHTVVRRRAPSVFRCRHGLCRPCRADGR